VRSPRLPLSIALAVTAGAIAYPLLRIGAALAAPEPDPAIVVWVTRNAYGTRVVFCAYAAALAWPAAYRWTRTRPDGAARALAPAIAFAFAALSLQLALWP
jgi:hypothetical protein